MEISAYAVTQQGGAPTPFTYHATLGRHDVLVRLTHRSITRGDTQFIDNDWGDTRYPLVPGHEMVGIVEQAGPDVGEVRVGDRVGIGYQVGACFECPSCSQGLEQFCARQTVIGVSAYGGLADQIVVDSRFAFPLPSALDSAAATPLLSSGLTVYSATAHAQLPPRARVAVLGIGGLGRLGLRVLGAMGHEVAAFSRSADKRDLIRRLGADYIDGSDSDVLAAHRATFDFILSTVNATFDLNSYLALLKPEGRFCFVATPLEPLPLRGGLLYDYGRRSIYGSYVGSRSDAVRMLDFAAAHDIRPDVEVMPFARMNDAIQRIRNGEASTALVLES